MANSKTIWRGSGSAQLTITSIQTATANGHISSYAFYCDTTDLSGNTINGKSHTTTIKGNARVNKTKDYTITSYLIYAHKFGNNSTTATSNRVNNTITVHEPLDNQSLKSISLPSNGNWVWSNAVSKDFTITPTLDTTYSAYSYEGQYISDSTTPTVAKGYIQSSTVGDITGAIKTLTWHKTTSGSTDLKTEYENITIKVKSTEKSAPSAVEIANRTATIQVRNAVTGLSGLANKELYAGSDAVQVGVTITPSRPYSDALVLVNENGQDTDGVIRSDGGAVVELDEQSIWFNAEEVIPGTPTQTIKFKVRSRQSATAVDTDLITFTVNAVANITGQTVVEGQSISVPAGIGTIKTVTITSGREAINASASGASLSITGLAVDADTPWSVTVTNTAGATITISGKTTYLSDVSTSINTGDYIIIGTELLAGLGDSISQIITQPAKGKASLENGKLKYEAYVTDGPIAAATYSIKVKGANGATRTVNIAVNNITTELS